MKNLFIALTLIFTIIAPTFCAQAPSEESIRSESAYHDLIATKYHARTIKRGNTVLAEGKYCLTESSTHIFEATFQHYSIPNYLAPDAYRHTAVLLFSAIITDIYDKTKGQPFLIRAYRDTSKALHRQAVAALKAIGFNQQDHEGRYCFTCQPSEMPHIRLLTAESEAFITGKKHPR